MKSKSFVSVLLLAYLFLAFACKDDAPEINSMGKVSLSFNPEAVKDASGGRIRDLSNDVAGVLVSIETSAGVLVHELKQLKLLSFGEALVSEELQLPHGSYRVTKFMVVDASGKVIYATPLAGSGLAHLVQEPLPIPFIVTGPGATVLMMEAVATEETEPEDFGYAAFAVSLINYKTYQISATIAETSVTGPATGTLKVVARNENGYEMWTHSWEVTDHIQIKIPLHYRYSFIFSKPGYISHAQHYLASDLNNVKDLSFELIPEGSEDFIIKDLGYLKIYYPADRTKLYTRIDLNEETRLSYLWIDRGATDCSGYLSIGDFISREYFDSKLPDVAVNLFDNTPFANATNMRDYIDMDLSEITEDFDRDVYITTFTLLETSTDDFFSDYFDWNFDFGPFYNHWCPITHLSGCSSNGEVSGSGTTSRVYEKHF